MKENRLLVSFLTVLSLLCALFPRQVHASSSFDRKRELSGEDEEVLPASGLYHWPENTGTEYEEWEMYTEHLSPKTVIELRYGNLSPDQTTAKVTAEFYTKRKSHLVREAVKEVWRQSFFYELHIACSIDLVDVTDWPEDEATALACNIGMHDDLSMRDWLSIQLQYTGSDSTDKTEWYCDDKYQLPNGDGLFGGEPILMDTYQNCYYFPDTSSVTILTNEQIDSEQSSGDSRRLK